MTTITTTRSRGVHIRSLGELVALDVYRTEGDRGYVATNLNVGEVIEVIEALADTLPVRAAGYTVTVEHPKKPVTKDTAPETWIVPTPTSSWRFAWPPMFVAVHPTNDALFIYAVGDTVLTARFGSGWTEE